MPSTCTQRPWKLKVFLLFSYHRELSVQTRIKYTEIRDLSPDDLALRKQDPVVF